MIDDDDYEECLAIYEENHNEPYLNALGFPTVVAERDGKIIGFLSTIPSEDRVMAGPLEIKGGKNVFLFIRLIEAYTNVMKAAGIKQFEFFTAADRIDQFSPDRLKTYADFGVKFNQVYNGNAFFTKEVA